MTRYYPTFTETEINALRDGIVLASVHQQIEVMLRDPTARRVDDDEHEPSLLARAAKTPRRRAR